MLPPVVVRAYGSLVRSTIGK